MANVRIIFGSETGNTESIAEMVAEQIKAAGHNVACESAANVNAGGLAEGYDCVLMGVSIWGTDTIELQSDFAEYEGEFESMGLAGKKVAAFASGDSSFEFFCGGVDYIEEQFRACGAEIIEEGLRVEGDASGSKEDVIAWAESVLKSL